MKIDSVDAYPVAIDRDEVFRIATGSSKTAENVPVRVSSDETVGWGNASPNSVTGETTESILKALKIMKEEVEGRDVKVDSLWEELRRKVTEDRAAQAGLDIALHDLKGKKEGKRVFEMYGGEEEGVLTDRTIGIMPYTKTIDHASEYKERGFKALKIKVGLSLLEDIRKIQAVREEVGPEMKLWIDANQGYTVQEAITFCEKVKDFDIEFIEQPVKEGDLQGLKEVSQESSVPIMADEAMKDHEMARKMCEEGICDMVNIKLMKSAGITGGRKIVEVLEKYGVDAMVGCMSETAASIAAGVHLHETSERIKYADLDGHFMLSDNIATGLEFKDGRLWTGKEPGLGVQVQEDKIDEYLMDMEGKI